MGLCIFCAQILLASLLLQKCGVEVMDPLETINTRRSIRKFEDKKVPDDLVKKILAAAMNAPSAGNEQPWHFIVITNKSILEKISKIHPYVTYVKDAPLGILVCGDLNLEKYKGLWMIDCSAATENILLAAHSLDLGAVWTGIYPMQNRIEKYRELLYIPDNVTPLAFVPIGYPAQKPRLQDRFKQDRVHYNKW